jgi:hypothetical protein
MNRLDPDDPRTYEDLTDEKSKSHLIVKIKPRVRVKKTLSHVRVKKIPSRVLVKTPRRKWINMRVRTSQEPSSCSPQDLENESSVIDGAVYIDKNSLEDDSTAEIITLFESIIAILESSLIRPDDEKILIQ